MRIVAGKFGSRPIKSVPGNATRPTTDKVKGAIYSSLGNSFSGGSMLDCYSGTGSMALEAISRGMDHATMVDLSKQAIQTIKENVKTLKVEKQCTIICGNIFSVIERLGKFDFIFVDPPYAKQKNEELLIKLADHLNESGIIVIESDKDDEIMERVADLILYKQKVYGITRISYYQRKDELS